MKADLTRADFGGARLTGATVASALFNEANLRGVRGIHFDDNEVRGARFTPSPGWPLRSRIIHPIRSSLTLEDTDDAWSLLRRTYIGSTPVLVWLLFLAFVIPRLLTVSGDFLLDAF